MSSNGAVKRVLDTSGLGSPRARGGERDRDVCRSRDRNRDRGRGKVSDSSRIRGSFS